VEELVSTVRAQDFAERVADEPYVVRERSFHGGTIDSRPALR
jgi:hypothetical protein